MSANSFGIGLLSAVGADVVKKDKTGKPLTANRDVAPAIVDAAAAVSRLYNEEIGRSGLHITGVTDWDLRRFNQRVVSHMRPGEVLGSWGDSIGGKFRSHLRLH